MKGESARGFGTKIRVWGFCRADRQNAGWHKKSCKTGCEQIVNNGKIGGFFGKRGAFCKQIVISVTYCNF
jgi:hypothetical protein